MAMSKFSKSAAALPPSVRENPLPPIPFVSKVKKMDKVDGTDAEKYEWIKLEFLMAFHEIENLMPMKEPADKPRMFRTLLKGQVLS
jgi:hypothetical protein